MKKQILTALAACLITAPALTTAASDDSKIDCYQVVFMAGASFTIIDESQRKSLPQSRADTEFHDMDTLDLAELIAAGEPVISL